MANRSSAAGIAIALRIPRKPAAGSERAQPLIPIEVRGDCDVAPCSRVGVLISTFDRLGVKFLALGDRLAQAGACGRPNRAGTDLDSPVAENELSRDLQICE